MSMIDPNTEANLRATASMVDECVANGASVEDVLAERQKSPGGSFWLNPVALRPYSRAVDAWFCAREGGVLAAALDAHLPAAAPTRTRARM
ncbi:MAG TPA: hypothetical protein PK080_00365 [Hyphomonadaceae bacterium]|nr:hypothetical protein [Hyphomonadaceae bacterium]